MIVKHGVSWCLGRRTIDKHLNCPSAVVIAGTRYCSNKQGICPMHLDS